jgi:hypothetical protein
MDFITGYLISQNQIKGQCLLILREKTILSLRILQSG